MQPHPFPTRCISHSEQSGRLELRNGDRSKHLTKVLWGCVHFCPTETEHQGLLSKVTVILSLRHLEA